MIHSSYKYIDKYYRNGKWVYVYHNNFRRLDVPEKYSKPLADIDKKRRELEKEYRGVMTISTIKDHDDPVKKKRRADYSEKTEALNREEARITNDIIKRMDKLGDYRNALPRSYNDAKNFIKRTKVSK